MNRPRDAFETTQWGLVLEARHHSHPGSEQAFAQLCEAYWLPLYTYVRRRVRDQHQAQDLTQSFFAAVLEKDFLCSVDPSRGRFRAFLLTAIKRFVANEWKRQLAVKRGGGMATLSLDFEVGERRYQAEPAEMLTAEQVYLRNWARTLLDHVFERLRIEFEAAGKADQFRELSVFVSPHRDDGEIAAVAARLKMTPGAVRTAAHRLRQQYRAQLRQEIARTVADPSDIEDEVRSLFTAFDP